MDHRLFASCASGAPVSTGLLFFSLWGVGGELVEIWWSWWVVAGTLLGPEGSGASLGFQWASPALVLGAPFFVGWSAGALVGLPPVF